MASGDMAITLEIEPIVKVACKAIDCKHNLARDPRAGFMMACNLKHLTIGKTGQCESYEPIKPQVTNAG